ncbi:hypothetical protein MUP77_03765 [Candidatus Bathyarchaeota archaeon]|nr:hypothetical protein [Candidatus Bathyarchaeota archaeon]
MNSATIIIDSTTLELVLKEKEFSTGSKGFWAGEKLTLNDGRRYQVQVQAVLIGSKGKQ